MKKYVFEGKVTQVASCVSAPEESAMTANDFSKIPDWIVFPDGSKFDLDEDLIIIKENQGKSSRNGYWQIPNKFGFLAVKEESSSSPNYGRERGHGSCYFSMLIRADIDGIKFENAPREEEYDIDPSEYEM
jgi:hypothetical protein